MQKPFLAPLLALLLLLPLAGPARAGLPPEDRCPTLGVSPGGTGTDAVPRRLQEGSKLSYDTIAQLRVLLPREIWQNRHIFVYPGMQMLICGCHRRYPVPEFFRDATGSFYVIKGKRVFAIAFLHSVKVDVLTSHHA